MARVKPQIGDRVTCREREEAYSSRSACNPECWFDPGDIGTVVSVDVPVVRNTRGHLTFCCVDFYKDGIPYGKHGESPWRVGLYYDNMVILTRNKPARSRACSPCQSNRPRLCPPRRS